MRRASQNAKDLLHFEEHLIPSPMHGLGTPGWLIQHSSSKFAIQSADNLTWLGRQTQSHVQDCEMVSKRNSRLLHAKVPRRDICDMMVVEFRLERGERWSDCQWQNLTTETVATLQSVHSQTADPMPKTSFSKKKNAN
jgi:hypothetical protein